ncbi:TetR/AcrR family transcriptional regulator [Microbacterium sp. AK031]|uniref:TetR/AcrR family transcriptional regulator n=1 Tax=Microbacterium sp. AK031 TaxID=2723076 RepID=UPI0021687921|nr:TetR/AcrR family transcriptional regulator [Microbacterium sp. AK031]MCS3843276.1 AcrR family transcriptional regulator [Microbacterium sp. AK031]
MKTSSGERVLRPSSVAKREAILDAAQAAFLANGYDAVTMDTIARDSEVAKQTLYGHFGSKEALFLELVRSQTRAASERVLSEPPAIVRGTDARSMLGPVLREQLAIVLAPNLLALRRLVIGLLPQFPDLARELYEHGAQRAIRSLAEVIGRLDAADLLSVADAELAATQLNWLVMGEPVNRAMLLGDAAARDGLDIAAHVDAALDVFLAAYRRPAGATPPE